MRKGRAPKTKEQLAFEAGIARRLPDIRDDVAPAATKGESRAKFARMLGIMPDVRL